ncbi:hypothetical protein [Streptomyces sp. NPDC006195]|uniref:hypothetical protein n=1 Tax=unclassified Streptomyces TaxID=2593676 RepID=UPI0033BA8458
MGRDGVPRLRLTVVEPGQTHGHVTEVDLRLVTGQVGLRHEGFNGGFARGRENLRLPVGDVAQDHLVGHIGAVLLDEPVGRSV